MKRALEQVFLGPVIPSGASSAEQALTVWLGSDEAGKGDYLGPLVVAAFRADKATAQTLQQMGVQDSKAIRSQEKCRDIARQLFIRFKDRIGVVELIPGNLQPPVPPVHISKPQAELAAGLGRMPKPWRLPGRPMWMPQWWTNSPRLSSLNGS